MNIFQKDFYEKSCPSLSTLLSGVLLSACSDPCTKLSQLNDDHCEDLDCLIKLEKEFKQTVEMCDARLEKLDESELLIKCKKSKLNRTNTCRTIKEKERAAKQKIEEEKRQKLATELEELYAKKDWAQVMLKCKEDKSFETCDKLYEIRKQFLDEVLQSFALSEGADWKAKVCTHDNYSLSTFTIKNYGDEPINYIMLDCIVSESMLTKTKTIINKDIYYDGIGFELSGRILYSHDDFVKNDANPGSIQFLKNDYLRVITQIDKDASSLDLRTLEAKLRTMRYGISVKVDSSWNCTEMTAKELFEKQTFAQTEPQANAVQNDAAPSEDAVAQDNNVQNDAAPSEDATLVAPIPNNSQWLNMKLSFAQSKAEIYENQAMTFLNNYITAWNGHDAISLANLADDNIYLLGKIYSKDSYLADMQRRFTKHQQARQMPDGDVFVNIINAYNDKYLSFEFSEKFTNDGSKESSANKIIITRITPKGLRIVHESDDATDFSVAKKFGLIKDNNINSCQALVYKIIATSPAQYIDCPLIEDNHFISLNEFSVESNNAYSVEIESRSSENTPPVEYNYDVNLNNRSLHYTLNNYGVDLEITVKLAPKWDNDIRRLCH